jgi:hypothetical protein
MALSSTKARALPLDEDAMNAPSHDADLFGTPARESSPLVNVSRLPRS